MNQYDNPEFFSEYAKMSRSQYGLEGAGEWHQLEPMFPELAGKAVLDLGCGYGWHCKYAAEHGATSVLGIDQSARMIEEAKHRNAGEGIEYRVCDLLDFAYPEETYFGRKKLADIKTKDVEMFLTKLRLDGLSDSLQSKCKSMLSQIFDKAIANDILIKNPAKYAEKIKKGLQKEKEAFTVDEFSLLMANLPENWIGWSIRLMLCTGMRTQELLALEPRFIAEDGSYIEIRQAVKREKGTAVIGPPKSRDSERIVLVPEKVQYCARLLRDTTNRFIWESPKKPGHPCNPSHFGNQYEKAISSVEGVRYLTPHSCRHTYVTLLMSTNTDVRTIQSFAGHADMKMTLHYSHAEKNARQRAVEQFNDAFLNRQEETTETIWTE